MIQKQSHAILARREVTKNNYNEDVSVWRVTSIVVDVILSDKSATVDNNDGILATLHSTSGLTKDTRIKEGDVLYLSPIVSYKVETITETPRWRVLDLRRWQYIDKVVSNG